jgi:hypothetical protein
MSKVEISIRRKRPVIHATPKHKGPLDIKTEPDYLKRRLKGGVIKFYDLAQKSDGHGGWIQNNFTYDPGLVVHPSPDPDHASDHVYQVAPLTLAKLHEFEASILTGVEAKDFPTTFRQIKKSVGNSFPIQVSTLAGQFDFSSPEWVEEGLKVKAIDFSSTDATLIRVLRFNQQGGYAETLSVFYDSYPDITKYTNEPSFDSPTVAFTGGVNDQYFLMPFFCGSFCSSFGPPAGGIQVQLNNFYHIQPRNFENPNYIANWSFVDAWEHGAPPPEWNEALSYHTGLTGSKTYTITYTERATPPNFGAFAITIAAGGSFPIYPLNPTQTPPNVQFGNALLGENGEESLMAGMLLGIVKQGEKLYYLWATSHPA